MPSGGGHTRNSSDGETAITFEDKRKENFEAGRLELERRRKAIKEQQEREAVRIYMPLHHCREGYGYAASAPF